MSNSKQRVLFICGSRNQTTQLHQVARELSYVEAFFTPYYGMGVYELCRELGLLDFTIMGGHWREECLIYLNDNRLAIDVRGQAHRYDLVVTCQDLVVPENVRNTPAILVQEGMVDPIGLGYHLVRRAPRLPRWLASTAATGLSNWYTKFCVASEGFRALFRSRGVDPNKMVVTGIPNFSVCDTFRHNNFPFHGYALVCTSDARETFKLHQRRRYLKQVRQMASDRQIIVKLHPNEQFERAKREVSEEMPGALVFTSGSAEEMVANCDLLFTEWSSLALVGLALDKTVHSLFNEEELRKLVPLQTPFAASNIADVCRSVLLGESDGGAKFLQASPLRRVVREGAAA